MWVKWGLFDAQRAHKRWKTTPHLCCRLLDGRDSFAATISERTAYEPHSKREEHARGGAGWRGFQRRTSTSFSRVSSWLAPWRSGRAGGRRRRRRTGTKRATRRPRARWRASPCLPCPCSGRTSSASPAEEPRGAHREEGVLPGQVVQLLLEEEEEEREPEEEEEGANPDSCYSLGQTYLGEFL